MRIDAKIYTAATVAGVLLTVSIIGSAAASEPGPPYRIGQYWEYVHEGPRPGAVEPEAIDGQRIVQVVGNVADDANERWVIEDKFTNDPNVIGRLHVGSDRMLTFAVIANEKNEAMTLVYRKPIPHQLADMAVGETMHIETAVVTNPGSFTVPLSIEIKRLEDETVETSAGLFTDCRRYTSVTDSVVDVKIAKIPFKEHRRWWYSDQVGANVKEIYTKDDVKSWIWSKKGYTCTSTLTAFGIRDVSEQSRAAAVADVNTIAAATAHRPANRNYKAILAIVACVVVIAVIFARHKKRTKGATGQ
ncbi:MAG: hypothetical protein ACYS8Z_06045 [Planctomycetota bacterium]|jgi:hypothetical protein